MNANGVILMDNKQIYKIEGKVKTLENVNMWTGYRNCASYEMLHTHRHTQAKKIQRSKTSFTEIWTRFHRHSDTYHTDIKIHFSDM